LLLPPQPPISSTPLIPQTNPIGGVNQSVGVVPGLSQTNPIGGAGTGQNFGALPGDPGSPTYDPNAAAATAEQSGWDIGFRHNYAKHQHWRNHYPPSGPRPQTRCKLFRTDVGFSRWLT
jgi:hypothetical protein